MNAPIFEPQHKQEKIVQRIEGEPQFVLVSCAEGLALKKIDEPKLGAIYVDFVHGALAHRRKFGGGKSQAIAKAVGIKQGVHPRVLDATAGLGRDAFVLASLGCTVMMLERHPVIVALLEDGLKRASADEEIGDWIQARLHLTQADSIQGLLSDPIQLFDVDVVYLDPMYPSPERKRKKT